MSLRGRYSEALQRHLLSGSEETLAEGYAIGRWALEQGRGLLELAAAHHEALAGLHPDDARLERAGQFFAETLAPFEMAYHGYRDANAELQEVNAHLADRNEQLRHANDSAQALTRDLEAFSYSVSHDLRAPLRAIDGFSLALKEDWGNALGAEGQALLDRVRAAAQRMGGLIDDLLSLSRVSRVPLKKERVDVTELARSIGAALQQGAPSRKVDFTVAEGLWLQADPGLFRIALENLLGNAWKFSAKVPQPKIEVGAVPHGFFVRDNGAGFDMSAHPRLFGPFQRLHTAAEFEGTGIGLATVRRIVERHGGTLTGVGAIGQGATFTLTLPEA